MALVTRLAEQRLADLVDTFRVVIVNGPRQSGKTTLLRQFQDARGGEFRSLDAPGTLELARSDPTTFVMAGRTPRIFDEVQRGGDQLVLSIKYVVDRNNARGQFVLSGSTRFLTVPHLSESLAGRAAFVDLWPFAVAERVGAPGNFCDLLFQGPTAVIDAASSRWSRSEYLELICAGGYPEVVTHGQRASRRAWFDGYMRTVVRRDVQSFADLQHADVVPRLLALVAARAGGTAVLADLAQATDLAQLTTRNYLSYLETVFLLGRVPAWGTNLTAKVARTPRLYLTDPGLAAHLLAVDPAALARLGHPALGGLVETLVYGELLRLLAISDVTATVRFFRDRDGREIDFILERPNGEVVAIEVKASATVTSDDFRHLRWLRDRIGDRLAAGYVLHLGTDSGSFGDGMAVLPLSAMWHHRTW